jgi:hypothetical protein
MLLVSLIVMLVTMSDQVFCFYPDDLSFVNNATKFFFDHESLTYDSECPIEATRFETYKDLTQFVIYGGVTTSPCISENI